MVAIEQLLNYALESGLIQKEDVIYSRNKLLELFQISDYTIENNIESAPLEEILNTLLNYAIEKGFIEDTQGNRDLFDTKIMGLLTPWPSTVISKFWSLYKESPERATDFYYDFSQATDYIRKYRIKKDKKWKYQTEYGELDITINLSKPEKDPKDIANQRNKVASSYPKCLLCKENEGYAGRSDHPARQNHRIIPITINNEPWGFQYSPYVYYNEHCIVFKMEHDPMKIERATFVKLLDFVELFPHYFLGSNADLPIVGGSILSHDHYQGGHYEFALTKAKDDECFTVPEYEDVKVSIVKWPMSVLRLESPDKMKLINLCDKVLQEWKHYSDESVGVYAFTGDTPHHTITPIVRRKGENYQVDLVLRNNITTEEHPLGVFHPHEELHNIKKENIGLIEVMGLAVLPARLKNEMELLKTYLLENLSLKDNEHLAKHDNWVSGFRENYHITKDNVDMIIEKEIGKVYLQVLEHAGVFKRDEAGQAAFRRFIKTL